MARFIYVRSNGMINPQVSFMSKSKGVESSLSTEVQSVEISEDEAQLSLAELAQKYPFIPPAEESK